MKMIFAFFLMFVILFVFNITIVKADCNCNDGRVLETGDVSAERCAQLKADGCGSGGSTSNAPIPLPNPLTGRTTYDETKEGIPVLLGKIINSVMGIIGSLALVMFIYGGATWMLSGGNQEQVTKGKNVLIWATAGLVIIFTAYALVKFVLNTVTGS